MYYRNLNYDIGFFQFSIWPTASILIWSKNLRLNGKMDITSEFYTTKIAILHVYYTNLNYDLGFFQFSTWLTAAILFFEKASVGKTRDNSNFDSGHNQVVLLKYSAFYIFFHFHIAENLMLLGYKMFFIIRILY